MTRVASSIFVSALLVTTSCSKDPSPVVPGVNEDGGVPPSTMDGGNPGPRDGGNPDGSPVQPKMTVTNEQITVDAKARDYLLAVPKSYSSSKKYPLILVFHGDGGDGPSMRAGNPLESATDQDAILAYPSGINATWDLFTPWAGNTDNHFVDELITALKEKYEIGLVFADGYSNGGFFINQVATRRSAMFKAIVVHAGGAPGDNKWPPGTTWPDTNYYKSAEQKARPADGVATLVFHGSADTGVEPISGEYAAQYWSYVNTCGATLSDGPSPPCKQYDGCAPGKPVLWCLVPDLGHVVWRDAAPIEWAFIKSLL